MDFEWQDLHISDMQALNDAQKMVHQAVQFIGLVGKQVIPQEDDDSNTTMEWRADRSMFIGEWVNGIIRVGFSLQDFSISVLNSSDEIVRSKELDGRTMKSIFSWLKMELIMNGALAQNLEMKVHYKLAKHPVNQGGEFKKPNSDILKELARHRTNAQNAIAKCIEGCEHASKIRTWPHHFDTGSYIPIKFDDDGDVSQAFSIGYAPADELIDSPYYYVTQWAKTGKLDYSNKPELSCGIWHPGGLAGSALPMSELIIADNQQDLVESYIEVTKEWSLSANVIL